jgi:transcriptional regulator EpsA
LKFISGLLGNQPAQADAIVLERRRGKVALAPDFSQKILSIICSSHAIQKHIDFYTWLQSSVAEVLPHNMLLACWGDFVGGGQNSSLKYDLTSNLPNVSTQALIKAPEKVDDFMQHLHKLWTKNNSKWFVVNDLDLFIKEQGIDKNCFKAKFPEAFNHLNSMLIYGINDLRGSDNCLYVFFSEEKTFKVQDSVMGLIMPHIDAAIRRIQHLDQMKVVADTKEVVANTKEYLNYVSRLSVREQEIVYWVRQGKTNSEMANILFISQNTVKTHLKNIFEKLEVTKRAEAIGKLSMEFHALPA